MAMADCVIDSILTAIADQKQQEYLASKMQPFTIASTMFNFRKVIDSMAIKQDGRQDEMYLSHQALLEDEAEPESMGEKEKHMPLQRVMPNKQPDINLQKLESHAKPQNALRSNDSGSVKSGGKNSRGKRSLDKKYPSSRSRVGPSQAETNYDRFGKQEPLGG